MTEVYSMSNKAEDFFELFFDEDLSIEQIAERLYLPLDKTKVLAWDSHQELNQWKETRRWAEIQNCCDEILSWYAVDEQLLELQVKSRPQCPVALDVFCFQGK